MHVPPCRRRRCASRLLPASCCSQTLSSPDLPLLLLLVQATIYYDETEEREEGADLEELIRDGQIAFSERSLLCNAGADCMRLRCGLCLQQNGANRMQ